jgi:cellulose synthase/poly-beta-1,6-N-acetylglucosamine synthase-like glycosyltransferase
LRALAFHRLDLPCQLMGTGMAFPWTCICGVDLASDHIVEDMKLGIELARAGTPPLFCPDARVTSTFPATQAAVITQRTRWEHGHLDMILREARKLFVQALARHDGDLMALAIDLCVPPLTLLMLLLVAVFAASALFLVIANAALPLALATVALIMSATAVLLAWSRYGRSVISFVDIARAPFYALWKVPLYLRFLGGKQQEWVRTRRDTD